MELTLKEKIEAKKQKAKQYQKEYYIGKLILLDKQRKYRNIGLEEPKVLEYDDGKFDGTSNEVCNNFGCNRKLSITEKLFGNKCINHSKN